ncbi:MAG: hypothetical protein CVT95_06095 [Bacteroidetes bacterium HGW-Bacteroidetes-12]|nr:MAG: hypothetical protein CVT95_06095 [Bacteroidetes bacterium HGW-Bacteroidetes-12]
MKKSIWVQIQIRLTLTFTFVFLFVVSTQSQSLLYKVTGSEMSNPVYIYGTIHALPQADFFIDDIVMEKFSKAEKIVFEIDMSNPSMMAEVQSAMMMQGNSIDQLVTEQEYLRLKQFFADSLQLPIDMLKHVKPLLMSSFMLPKIVGEQPASYEGFFVQKAMEMEKSIAGIETVAEQIGYMDKIPLQRQVKMLMESIDDFNESRVEFQDLVNVYKTRDIERVYEVLMEASEEYKEFGEYLIDARNKIWIPRIIEMGNHNICFIAVGCGHLGGENGIINLLKIEGFNVDPVENKY